MEGASKEGREKGGKEVMRRGGVREEVNKYINKKSLENINHFYSYAEHVCHFHKCTLAAKSRTVFAITESIL
jgi:hypothetical protein